MAAQVKLQAIALALRRSPVRGAADTQEVSQVRAAAYAGVHQEKCGMLSDPVAWLQHFVERRFLGARLGLPVVTPFDDRRQRHQNRFSASARL